MQRKRENKCCSSEGGRKSGGHTRSLLWKNFLLWRRTWCLSIIELLSPILLCLVLIYLRGMVDYEVVPSLEIREVTYDDTGDVGYSAVYHYPFIEEKRMSLREEE